MAADKAAAMALKLTDFSDIGPEYEKMATDIERYPVITLYWQSYVQAIELGKDKFDECYQEIVSRSTNLKEFSVMSIILGKVMAIHHLEGDYGLAALMDKRITNKTPEMVDWIEEVKAVRAADKVKEWFEAMADDLSETERLATMDETPEDTMTEKEIDDMNENEINDLIEAKRKLKNDDETT